MSRRWASVAVVNLLRRESLTSAWRWASTGPAACSPVLRTGLVSRCATVSPQPPAAELGPPGLDGASGVVPPKVAASCLTLCLLCWFLVGSRVGASTGWRMPSRGGCSCGSSGASSRSLPVRCGCAGGSGCIESARALWLCCRWVVGSRVGASVGGRMPAGRTGAGAGSDGVGETLTAPLAGTFSSSVSSPKRGASAAASLGERSELEELGGL